MGVTHAWSTKRADELTIVGGYHPRHSTFSCTFYSCSQAAGIELSISFAMPMYFLLYQCPAEQRAHFTFLPPLNVTGSGPQGRSAQWPGPQIQVASVVEPPPAVYFDAGA